MGAESSVFEDYDLDEPSVASKSTWTLRYGRFNDELDVTVLSEQKENKQKWSLLQKNIKFLKSLRHPCILKYLNVAEVSSELYLVIERCSPLPAVLDSLDPIEITTGIYSVLEALSFLHEQAGMSHNNICLDSVYVTSKGTWKIGELQHCCKFLEVTPEFLKNSRPFRNEDSISPEEKAEKLTITKEMGHTRDVFSFGVMAENLLEYLIEIGEMSKTFELLVQDKCLNQDPKQRPRIQTIMKDQLFSNDLLLITKFLSEVTLKSQKDKEEFFSSLFPRLANLSEEVIAKQLVHLLLSRFVLLETSASETIVPDILVPKRGMTEKVEVNSQRLSPLLSVELYKKFVIPELFKMFHCHDYHIRMILLTYFSQFVDLFEKKDLEEVIFPQVLLGVRDCHEDLASLSLHCLAEMVKVLGRDTVIGGKSKQYFTKGTPKHQPKSSVEKESFKTLDKVLLKDLATYSAVSHTATNSCNVMDDKRQERQARLKEQRLARDQKRREQQQRRAERREQGNEVPQVERAEGRIIRGSESDNPNPTINGCRETLEKDSPTLNEIPERKISSPFEEQDDSTFDVKVSKSWSDDRLDPEVYVTSDHSEDDWSDWENNMAEQPSATPATESAQTNYSIEHIKKDDDIYNKSSPKNQPSSEKDITTHNTEHNEIQPLPKQNSKKALKLQSTKRKESPQNNQTLGAEYEIKSTSFLPEEAPKEIDFFADLGLTPEFSKGKLSEQTVQREEVHSNKSSAGKTSNLLSYNLGDNNLDPAGWGEDSSGWGDDLNWAEED